jgi:hypothetical protein
MPLVSSAPPQVNYNIQIGYEIVFPKVDYLKANQDFTFHFHVNNISDGLLLTNSSINCRFHMYNSSGNHIIEQNNIVNMDSNRIDFSYKVSGGNFTRGQYSYLFSCNSSAFGGIASVPFMVTTTGEELKSPESILYFLVTLFAFSIFFFITWLFLNINGENPKDETGYLGITYLKYIKTALFPLVYVSFLWFFNFIIGLSNNYLGLTLYANTLGFIFMILTKLVYPIIIITLIVEIVLMVKDANIRKEYQSLWSQF